MLHKDHLLDLITEEKNKYASYAQLCSFYKVDIDPIVSAKCLSKIEILEHLLKLM